MEEWHIVFTKLFHLADIGKLCPYDPENFKDKIRLDRRYLTYNANERELYFSEWLYRKSDVEAFKIQHQDIIDRWRGKAVLPVARKTNRLSTQHHELAREFAPKLWIENPNMTIQDVISDDQFNALFKGVSYNEKTLRNWINDLCPNRNPGRRKTKR